MRRILVVLVFGLSAMGLKAQCCSAGNPVMSEGANTRIGGKILRVTSGYRYSLSDTYYNGRQQVDINGVERAWYNYSWLNLVYGINHKLSATAELGYFFNRTEQYKTLGFDDYVGRGLGDLNLGLRYVAWKDYVYNFELIPSIGVKLPIGVFDQKVDGVKLPITVQPSSGSIKYSAALFFRKGFRNGISLVSYNLFEYSSEINSRYFIYQYGPMSMFSLSCAYPVAKSLNVALQLRNENRGKATREHGEVVNTTGFNMVYAGPRLSFNLPAGMVLSTDLAWPVYRNYNGTQLGNAFVAAVSLSGNLDFNGL